jgi:hypothetical protein
VSRILTAIGCLSIGAFAFAITFACTNNTSHIYLGRPYDDQRQCLGDTAGVDVVSGNDPGLGCDPTCLIGKLDETNTVYVSTECPPFPMFFDTTGTDPRCAGALAASARNDICNDDGGGSSNPVVDAAPEATPSSSDASPDATSSSASDASHD